MKNKENRKENTTATGGMNNNSSPASAPSLTFPVILQVFAIIASVLLLSLPLASATTVRIFSGGLEAGTVELDQNAVVNRQMEILRNPNDPTFTDIKLSVQVNSASLAQSIEKVYLYKCRKSVPSDCGKLTPQVFDNFVDVELLWNDISDREGAPLLPQVANIMLLVKLKDANNRVSWLGFMDIFRRTDFNAFTRSTLQLQSIDLQAATPELVEPIKAFLGSFQMVPFSWITSATFTGTNRLFALAADAQPMEQVPVAFQSVVSSSPLISSITRDFTLVFPNSSSGLTDGLTLTQNPTFTPGDSRCQRDLGETEQNSCFDCGCPTDQYCAVPNPETPAQASCRSADNIALTILSAVPPVISACTQSTPANVSIRITNAPPGLPATLPAILSLGPTSPSAQSTIQQLVCSGTPPDYQCPAQLIPPVACGAGTFQAAPNHLNLTLPFQNGPAPATKDLNATIPTLTTNFNCFCQQAEYCDAGLKVCRSDPSIQLSLLSVESFKPVYDPAGDTINIQARILNAPSDMVVDSSTVSYGGFTTASEAALGSTDTTNCGLLPTGAFNCTFHLTIPDYNKQKHYVVRNNNLTFNVKYTNITSTLSRALIAGFSDITVPSQTCGNGVINTGETPGTCCIDVGCASQSGTYCDRVTGCQLASAVSLVVSSATPVSFTDCRVPHAVTLTAKVNNAPTGLQLSFSNHNMNNIVSGFPLQCQEASPAGLGVFTCDLSIPALEGCELPSKVLSANRLNFTVSFPNRSATITRELSATFPDLVVVPQFRVNDQSCERNLNENEGNSCADCGCGSFGPSFFCDFDPVLKPAGECKDRDSIRLVIDSPKQPVRFDSCEVSQKVTVKAHLDNAPVNSELTHFEVQVNGSASDTAQCAFKDEPSIFAPAPTPTPTPTPSPSATPTPTPSPVPATRIQQSIECVFYVSPVKTCHQTDIHRVEPNKLGLLLSFQDGPRVATFHSVTTDLPPVVLTQSVRSIYDIIQKAVADIRKNFDGTQEILRELLDWMDTCVEVAVALAFASIAAMIFVPLGVGLSQSSVSWTDALRAVSETSRAVMSTWSEVCKMIGETYKLQLEQKKIELQIINTMSCIEMNQHLIDTAQLCQGEQALNCFNDLAGCLSRFNIDGALSSIQGSVDRIGGSMGNIGNSMTTAGQNIADIFPQAGLNTNMVVLVNGAAQTGVCSYKPIQLSSRTGSQTSCDPSTLLVQVTTPQNTRLCQYKVAAINRENGFQFSVPANSPLSAAQFGQQVDGDAAVYDLVLYCERRNSNDNQFTASSDTEVSRQAVFFEKAIVTPVQGAPQTCSSPTTNGPCSFYFGANAGAGKYKWAGQFQSGTGQAPGGSTNTASQSGVTLTVNLGSQTLLAQNAVINIKLDATTEKLENIQFLTTLTTAVTGTIKYCWDVVIPSTRCGDDNNFHTLSGDKKIDALKAEFSRTTTDKYSYSFTDTGSTPDVTISSTSDTNSFPLYFSFKKKDTNEPITSATFQIKLADTLPGASSSAVSPTSAGSVLSFSTNHAGTELSITGGTTMEAALRSLLTQYDTEGKTYEQVFRFSPDTPALKQKTPSVPTDVPIANDFFISVQRLADVYGLAASAPESSSIIIHELGVTPSVAPSPSSTTQPSYTISFSVPPASSGALTALGSILAVGSGLSGTVNGQFGVTVSSSLPAGTTYSWALGSNPSTGLIPFETKETFTVTATSGSPPTVRVTDKRGRSQTTQGNQVQFTITIDGTTAGSQITKTLFITPFLTTEQAAAAQSLSEAVTAAIMGKADYFYTNKPLNEILTALVADSSSADLKTKGESLFSFDNIIKTERKTVILSSVVTLDSVLDKLADSIGAVWYVSGSTITLSQAPLERPAPSVSAPSNNLPRLDTVTLSGEFSLSAPTTLNSALGRLVIQAFPDGGSVPTPPTDQVFIPLGDGVGQLTLPAGKYVAQNENLPLTDIAKRLADTLDLDMLYTSFGDNIIYFYEYDPAAEPFNSRWQAVLDSEPLTSTRETELQQQGITIESDMIDNNFKTWFSNDGRTPAGGDAYTQSVTVTFLGTLNTAEEQNAIGWTYCWKANEPCTDYRPLTPNIDLTVTATRKSYMPSRTPGPGFGTVKPDEYTISITESTTGKTSTHNEQVTEINLYLKNALGQQASDYVTMRLFGP